MNPFVGSISLPAVSSTITQSFLILLEIPFQTVDDTVLFYPRIRPP